MSTVFSVRPGYNNVQIYFREFGGDAYINATQPVYRSSGYSPPQPVQPVVPVSQNQTGPITTEYGEHGPCRDKNLHQSKCFQSNGWWDAPNLGSIQGEPMIRTWRNRQVGSTLELSWD